MSVTVRLISNRTFKSKIVLMLQIVAYVELGLCWIVWMLAFVKPSKQAAGQKEATSAPASRWGIFLVMIGFMLTWMYVRPVGFQKSAAALIASMILGPLSVALGWAAARGERGPRTHPDRPLPLAAPPNLHLDAGNAADNAGCMDLVAHGYRVCDCICCRNRDSRPCRRTAVGRALQGFLRRLPRAHLGLHPVPALIALRIPLSEWHLCKPPTASRAPVPYTLFYSKQLERPRGNLTQSLNVTSNHSEECARVIPWRANKLRSPGDRQ